MNFSQANTQTIQCMGQDIRQIKVKGKTHDFNHDLAFSAHTINCGCHSIRLMFRVLGMYQFGLMIKIDKKMLQLFIFIKKKQLQLI